MKVFHKPQSVLRACFVGMTMIVYGLLSNHAYAVIESYSFDNDIDQQRYQHFIQELRCPKCQNQNLSGSDAPIAQDLRRQLYQLIVEGKTDTEITTFMVDRYGDFILYRPPFNVWTAILWLAPVIGLIIGAVVLCCLLRPKSSIAITDEPLISPVMHVSNTHQNDRQAIKAWPWYVALLIAIPLLAWMLYSRLGAWSDWRIQQTFAELATIEDQPTRVAQLTQLADQLSERLSQLPDYGDYLVLLGRTDLELNRYKAAADRFDQWLQYYGNDPAILAYYAQAHYLANDRQLSAKAYAAAQRALALDPRQVTALGLLGTASLEQGDLASARLYWQALLEVLPVDSRHAQMVRRVMQDIGGS